MSGDFHRLQGNRERQSVPLAPRGDSFSRGTAPAISISFLLRVVTTIAWNFSPSRGRKYVNPAARQKVVVATGKKGGGKTTRTRRTQWSSSRTRPAIPFASYSSWIVGTLSHPLGLWQVSVAFLFGIRREPRSIVSYAERKGQGDRTIRILRPKGQIPRRGCYSVNDSNCTARVWHGKADLSRAANGWMLILLWETAELTVEAVPEK